MHELKNVVLLFADLALFEGEGGGAAPSGATAPAAGEQTGDLSQVRYGIQNDAQPAPDTQADAEPAQEPEDRAQKYRDMVQGDYKDLYDADVQRIVKSRLKDMDNLRSQNAAQQDIIDRLASKYGVTDLKDIAEAIDSDTAMWEEEADKAGMTTEQYMQFQQLQRQNASLIREEQMRQKQMQQQQQVSVWMKEAEGVKQQYPGFNLEAELQNPRFGAMLKSGVPMGDAFRAIHFDELQNMTARAVAQQTEKAVTDNIRAKGSRPVENGTIQQGSFTVKSDVTKLSRRDRAEIARRAARGEMIRF